MLTGHEGMFVLTHCNARHGTQFGRQEYNLVPIAAQIIWAHDIGSIALKDLPNIAG